MEAREESLNEKFKEVQRLEEEAQTMHESQQAELERISNMTMEEARQMLIARIQKEAYHDAAVSVREIEQRARDEAEKKARNIIAGAIQRCAADHVAETTVSVVALPNDDMKGRIIGREGRNIRSLETATGVDLIIDDTPEAVIISAFDPVRREIARIALEKLITDGRIHPGRIEEMVEKARREVDNQIREAGEQGPCSKPIYTASITNWSSCWAACATAPAMARTCSNIPSKSPTWRASWPPNWARMCSSPSGPAFCTTSARPSTTKSRART